MHSLLCRIPGQKTHQYDKITHQCKCGKFQRGFAPKKGPVKPKGECQICEGKYAIDKDGTLCNHGYRRPGHGYIVGNCFGEGFRPYPQIDALKLYKEATTTTLGFCEQNLLDLSIAESFIYTVNIRSQPKEEFVSVEIKKGQELDSEIKNGRFISYPSFEELLKRKLAEATQKRDFFKGELNRIVERIAKANWMTP